MCFVCFSGLFFKLIRLNYRALSVEEETSDNQAQELWKTFLVKLQEAIKFVNTQSPNILEQLDALFNVIRFFFSY